MLFCSYAFLVFFLVVFTTYWSLPWHRGRVWVLLAASIYFYARWNAGLALLLCASSAGDYLIALAMEATGVPGRRRFLLGLSLVANLGLLCYFKYVNFFLVSLLEAGRLCGVTLSLPVLQVMLPVGISFYTFEAINYTVDVYRGKVRAARDLTHFMLFILFFPHLIAGPIVRARAFLPQVVRRKHWSWLRAHRGVLLFVLGMLKKLAIADRMPLYVDPVFVSPDHYSTSVLWLAAVAYAIQVYCDFSGYSDMALGLAHLFGYHLAPNFHLPFLAVNMADLWRRWHMSLSSWIRDYLFIPLGGSRGTYWQTTRNILLTFTLCGLWHGAGWNYVLWGFVTGVLLVVHTSFKRWCEQHPAWDAALQTGAGTALRIALTFICFCLTLVVFRNPTLTGSCTMLAHMMVPTGGDGMPLVVAGLYLTFAAVAAAHVIGQWDVERWLTENLSAPVRGVVLSAALSLAVVLTPGASRAFIYFQF